MKAHLAVIQITAGRLRPSYTRFRSLHFGDQFIMAYVITDTCIKDSLCVEVCPTDCIHPKQDEPDFEAATQMYVDPEGCIDCGACVPVCTSDSIHALEDVPEGKKDFVEKNAAYFKK
jgi:ferredoxin